MIEYSNGFFKIRFDYPRATTRSDYRRQSRWFRQVVSNIAWKREVSKSLDAGLMDLLGKESC